MNSTNLRGATLKWVKYLREEKLATGKDRKRVGKEEERRWSTVSLPPPPLWSWQYNPQGRSPWISPPLPKQKCIIRTEPSLSKRDFLAKNGKSVRCPRRAKCGGLAQTSLPCSRSLLWNLARHGERIGRSFTLSCCGHCKTWPADSQGKANRATDSSPFPLTLL